MSGVTKGHATLTALTVGPLRAGPLTTRQLARHLGITPPRAQRWLCYALLCGHVQRTPRPDGSGKAWAITPEGYAALPTDLPQHSVTTPYPRSTPRKRRSRPTRSLTVRALRLLETFGPLSACQIAAVLERPTSQIGSLLHDLRTLHHATVRVCTDHRQTPHGRRRIVRWGLTDAGRALLGLQGYTPIQAGATPHLALSRACADPLTVNDLAASVQARYGRDIPVTKLRKALHALASRGLLACSERPQGLGRQTRRVLSYVLTPAGEDMLTRLPRPVGAVV